MTQPIFFVNGEFVPAAEASLPLNDLGLVRGYGIFDYWRTYEGTPFHQREHLARFLSSASQIRLALPWSIDELSAWVDATLARNGLSNAGIRLIATGGPSSDFMSPQGRPSLVIMVTPAPGYPEAYYQDGCRAITAKMVRERPTVKSLNYIGAIMAVEAAKEQGAVEALYVTAAGHITEGTRANFFLIKGDQLITPVAEVLPGITRMAVLRLASMRFDVHERAIHVDELRDADEAFITSSTKEVLPIVQIDDQIIGNGKPGAKTRALHLLFREYAHSLRVQA